jgi:molybdenum cofactor biosynthesis protein B
MPRIDESRPFLPVNIALLTVSDTRTAADDRSGAALAEMATRDGHRVAARAIVPDDQRDIAVQLRAWIADPQIDVVIATGGTGVTGRDVTPEAIEPLLDKRIEGFSVIFHLVSYQTVGLSTLQSRALAGLIDGVFIFCLPGSNGAVRDGWDKVIAPQLDSRHKPCNMVELMPRLLEK